MGELEIDCMAGALAMARAGGKFGESCWVLDCIMGWLGMRTVAC